MSILGKKFLVSLAAFASVVACLISAAALAAAPVEEVLLWPDGAPGVEDATVEEKTIPPRREGDDIKRITNVTRPSMAVYKPPKETDTGAAVVICPGGGYNILAIGHEGIEVAAWLNSIGVTGIVLKYRVPWKRGQDANPAPLQDAQRAMRVARANAARWDIDPQRIGLLGFSAGGHLTAWAGTNSDQSSYSKVDASDDLSCRPDFLLLIYPAYLVDHGQENHLSQLIRINKQTPPTLLIHTQDDGVTAESSIYYYLAMKKAGVAAEMHIYPTGGHGYGLRKSDHTVSTWPARAETWLRSSGLLKKSAAATK